MVLLSALLALSAPPADGAVAARVANGPLALTVNPALQPAFDPRVPDYVTRCEPAERVTVAVSDTNGVPVSVDRQPAETSSFRTTLKIGRGQSFVVVVGNGSNRRTYTVRCLPVDFPQYGAQVVGQPQAAYYLVTPSTAVAQAPGAPYVVLFDNHGVPVWWYQEATGTPVDANLMPNGDLSWLVEKNLFNRKNPPALTWQVSQGFGLPASASTGLGIGSGIDLVEHRLDGTMVNRLDAVGSPTDFHEDVPLANGDFLMTSYALRPRTGLSPLFTTPVNALDATFQVVSPHGSLVYSWSAAGRISPAETAASGRGLVLGYPGAIGPAWDYQHIDSVAPDGDGYLISLAHTGAIYLVRASDGSIEWKLGGSPTYQSLTIVGDPNGATDFSEQSDARAWPDGTVSVYDNATGSGRRPRVLRFRIDTQARTATLVQSLSDPAVAASPCCGSARLLPGGDWVVAWGGTPLVNELTPYGVPVFDLTFAYPYYSYRAVAVLPGQLRAAALLRAMNLMTPRTPSGVGPPALTRLRASYGRGTKTIHVDFTLAWRARVRLGLEVCVVASSGNGAGCSRVVRLGGIVMRSGKRGPNHLSLAAALFRGGVSAGTYRVVATPISNHQTGHPVAVAFRIG